MKKYTEKDIYSAVKRAKNSLNVYYLTNKDVVTWLNRPRNYIDKIARLSVLYSGYVTRIDRTNKRFLMPPTSEAIKNFYEVEKCLRKKEDIFIDCSTSRSCDFARWVIRKNKKFIKERRTVYEINDIDKGWIKSTPYFFFIHLNQDHLFVQFLPKYKPVLASLET